MSFAPPEKIFCEYLLDPSNDLYPYFDELQRNPDVIHREVKQRSPNLPRVEWLGRTGNGEGKIVFPDSTVLTGTFKNFRLLEGSIHFPTGLRFKGRFRNSDAYMIDIFQSGTITFADGTYAKVEFDNLKLKRVEVFEKNNALLGRLSENEVLVVRPKISLINKRMDLLTFAEDGTGMPGHEGPSFTYSYFGLFVQRERPPNQVSAFFRRNPELVDCSGITSGDTRQESEVISRFKNDDDSLLRFEIQGFMGRIILFVDSPDAPSCGSGFYIIGDFVTPVALFPPNPTLGNEAPSVFMIRNRPQSVQTLKQVLRRLIDEHVMSKFGTSQFHDMEQTAAFNSKEAEYQQTLNRMVRKYESLQKQIDASKSEFRGKTSHLININNALQKKNEELIASEIDARNGRKKLDADLEKQVAAFRALKEEQEVARLAFKQETERLTKAQTELQTAHRRLQADFEGLKGSSKAKIDSLMAEKSEALAKVRRQEEEIMGLQQSLKVLGEQKARVEAEVVALSTANAQLERIIVSKDQQEVDLRTKMDSLKARNTKLGEEVSKSEEARAAATRELEACQRSYAHLAEQKRQVEESNGVYFFGTLKNGKKHGHCTFETSTSKMEGNFANNKLHGEGTMTVFAGPKVLSGDSWKEGVFGGKEMSLGAVKYRGPIVNNQMQGRGYFEFGNGFNLEATFAQDEIDATREIVLIDLGDGEETRVKLASDKRTLVSEAGKRWLMDFKTGNLVKN